MIDYVIAKAINSFGAGSFLDSLTILISNYIFLGIVFALIVAVIFFKDKKKTKVIVVALFIAVLLHLLITGFVMKDFVGDNIYFKERPYAAHPGDIIQLGQNDNDPSFPSGHTALVVGILTVLVFYYRKYWPYALAFALFMGFARIHNGMHYPSDVLFGFLFGAVYGLTAVWIAKKFFKK